MKPSSLHALVIDHHFGELSPEAAELLELHLAANEAARADADRILQSLAATRDAMLEHPELARVPALPLSRRTTTLWRAPFMPWLARAAAVLLPACFIGAGGFLAGRSSSSASRVTEAHEKPLPAAAPRKDGPWARYRMTFDPAGDGMQVVRVDTGNLEHKSIP